MDKIEQALGVLAKADELMRIGANGDAYEVMAEDYSEALATLRAELAGKGWQPIETAPRDGTRIVVWNGEAWVCHWRDGCWDDGDFHSNIAGATHWMPLPSPPALDRAREVPREGE